MTDEYESAEDDPEYADEPDLEDDPEIGELTPTDPKDMPPDRGDTIGGDKLPEEEG